jgi:hypothetical protein
MTHNQNDPLILLSQWQGTSRDAWFKASSDAQKCGGAFAELALNEARPFCNQPPPASTDEMSSRIRQSMCLGWKIRSIVEAAGNARAHPAKAGALLDAVRAFCNDVSLTDDDGVIKSQELTQRFANICR